MHRIHFVLSIPHSENRKKCEGLLWVLLRLKVFSVSRESVNTHAPAVSVYLYYTTISVLSISEFRYSYYLFSTLTIEDA